jgi:hypothetical protein
MWAAIEDPAERTETALRDLYARTERMYVSLLRDESVVPGVQQRLRDATATYVRSRTSSWRAAGYAGVPHAGLAQRSATRSRSRRGAR